MLLKCYFSFARCFCSLNKPARVLGNSLGRWSPSKPEGPRASDYLKTWEQPRLTHKGPNAHGKWGSFQHLVICQTSSWSSVTWEVKDCLFYFLQSTNLVILLSSPAYSLKTHLQSVFCKYRSRSLHSLCHSSLHFNLFSWHVLGNI